MGVNPWTYELLSLLASSVSRLPSHTEAKPHWVLIQSLEDEFRTGVRNNDLIQKLLTALGLHLWTVSGFLYKGRLRLHRPSLWLLRWTRAVELFSISGCLKVEVNLANHPWIFRRHQSENNHLIEREISQWREISCSFGVIFKLSNIYKDKGSLNTNPALRRRHRHQACWRFWRQSVRNLLRRSERRPAKTNIRKN